MHLTLVGLGLIGGSVLLAAHRLKQADAGISRLVGIDANPLTCRKACQWCDAVYPNLEQAASAGEFAHAHLADVPHMVMLATPVQQYANLALACQRCVPRHITITDAGSTKQPLFTAFRQAYGTHPPELVGGHPIAGSEQSGLAAAQADLFRDRLVVIVPSESSDAAHEARVRWLWTALGARLLEQDCINHDRILAYTSHLPHVLSYALVHYLGSQRDNADMFRFAAGGFRDFTRIAASDPVMWRDVAMSNAKPILAAIDGMMQELTSVRSAIAKGDAASLYDLFSRAKAIRDYFTRSQLFSPARGVPMDIVAHPCQALDGVIAVPGDKSISHRAVMLSALAEGTSQISNLLEGEDNLATIQAFRDMGVAIEGPEDGCVQVTGVGLDGLREPAHPLYMGNSGTAMRLMCGLLAGQKFSSRLTGDASLSSRPMGRVMEPLGRMGARITSESQDTAPLIIEPAASLQAIDYPLPMPSAQVKSCVLLAGLYAQGVTVVQEPTPTRDHTERMLAALGVDILRDQQQIRMTPPQRLQGRNWVVPGDISSAAFFLVAGLIVPHSNVVLTRVGVNPTRNGIITILRRMGADIHYEHETMVGEEPVADIHVRTSALQAIDIDADLIALAIDEFPILCIAAACASGQTRVSGASELRVKESDRITAMATGLRTLGIEVEETPDGICIQGGTLSGGQVHSYTDHRIAMAFAVAGCVASSPVTITECDNIATSFPRFIDLANALGMVVSTSCG